MNTQRIKVTVCGNSDSGKTALLQRYAYDKFPEKYTRTPFADVVNVEKSNILIWDTTGIDHTESNSPYYLNESDHVIYVMPAKKHAVPFNNENDINNFIEIHVKNIIQLQTLLTKNKDVQLYFVISKSDLGLEQANRVKTKLNIQLRRIDISLPKIFITSAKYNTGIKELFNAITSYKPKPSLAEEKLIETADTLKDKLIAPQEVKTKRCCCFPFFRRKALQSEQMEIPLTDRSVGKNSERGDSRDSSRNESVVVVREDSNSPTP